MPTAFAYNAPLFIHNTPPALYDPVCMSYRINFNQVRKHVFHAGELITIYFTHYRVVHATLSLLFRFKFFFQAFGIGRVPQ